MNSFEKVFHLIQEGNPVPLLAEKSLNSVFNELLEFDLIDITGDKVVLTLKGEEAKRKGLEKTLQELKLQKEFKKKSAAIQKKKSKIPWVDMARYFAFLLIFLLMGLVNCSSNI